jgi:hypothetical protein
MRFSALSQTINWPSSGSHQWWKFVLENTPGSGPYWNYLKVYDGPYVFESTLTEGTSTVSGSTCGSLTASGTSLTYLDSFLCNAVGPKVSLTSWISVADLGDQFIATTDATMHSIKWFGEVVITGGTLLFESNGGNYTLVQDHFAFTMSQRTGPSYGVFPIYSTPIASDCSPATTPPDYNPFVAVDDWLPTTENYFLGIGFVLRIGTSGPWTTTWGIFTPGYYPGSPSTFVCTKTP